ncbi:MAG: HutD family protein [Clostridia bacterium]|nr:HutD family protein [Clostridia bacterium]
MLKITEIKKETMPTSSWSGGTTTEIMIYPEGASYAARDFLFRISTASVELESSDFTQLDGFFRVIASLDGEMLLSHSLHCGEIKKRVLPLDTVHFFDGGIPTHCEGKARDLNLMMKLGALDGDMRFVEGGEKVVLPLDKGEFALVYSIDSGDARFAEADEADHLVFTAEGKSALLTVKLTDL